MKITVTQLKKALASKTGARSLTNISNIYEMIQETLFDISMNVAMPSYIRKVTFTKTLSPLSALGHLYELPTDFAPDGFIDLYKTDYITNTPSDRYGLYTPEFMQRSGVSFISIENIDGKQYLNVKEELSATDNYTLEYYSNSIVFSNADVRRADNLIVADTDYLMLSTDEYMLFLRVFSVISGVDVRPASAGSEVKVYGGSLAGYYEMFSTKYPSRKIINSSEY